MPGPYSLSDLPAPVAVRWVALALLRDGSRAYRRFKAEQTRSAGDELAICLTRLHCWTDVFALQLGDGLRPRHRRRLERLQSLGSLCRSLEHRRVSLETLTSRSHAAVHAFANELATQAGRRLHGAEADFRDAVLRRLPRLRGTLRRRLGSYRISLAPDGLSSLPCFRTVFTESAEQLLQALRKAFAAGGAGHEAVASASAQHLTVRLRSVLEAAGAEIPALAGTAGWLVPLSDLLDRVQAGNDVAAILLGETAPGDGDTAATLLRALYQRQQLDMAAAQARVRDDIAAIRAGIRDAFAGTVAQPREPEEIEIERKYLLDGLPVLPETVEVLQVDQGWLPGTRLLERLRRVGTPGGEEFFRTVKLGSGVSRIEVEEATQREVFEVMWPLTQGRRVHKTRYRVVADDGLTWEIDRFADLDLVLAEVEIPSADTPIRFPAWLRPHVVREVTDDGAYVNFNLAR